MSHPEIKRLTQADLNLFKELIRLFIDVFEEEIRPLPSDTHLKVLLEKTDFAAFVVILNHKVIGGLTAYELTKYYSENAELFIYDIAIDRRHQRKGLGKMLLESTKEYCLEKGITEIFVAANEEDTHALEFYNSTGGEGEKAVHFNYPIKRNSIKNP